MAKFPWKCRFAGWSKWHNIRRYGGDFVHGCEPVYDNNEIVEIQSVEEPIYLQELAEQITVEKDKEDVIIQ